MLMRIIQGFALGGEYGGAAIYVAEHAAANARGRIHRLGADLGRLRPAGRPAGDPGEPHRGRRSRPAFDAWGWRIPFLVSAGLLAISIYMRLKLSESPEFARMKAGAKARRRPSPRPSASGRT